MVKLVSFLTFVDDAKNKTTVADFQWGEQLHSEKRGTVSQKHVNQFLVNLYNNSSVKSLHIPLANLTSVVHI